ncbi:MAG: RHS repeat-associated core domain-containing protein, partial [Clostridiales bacterium]|nr:RHS repeat-associated core domain-containing protein [Clostridiales bacterium]
VKYSQGNTTTRYYYITNAQGDIVALRKADNTLAGTYEYDAYGKILAVKDANGNIVTSAKNIMNINPLRYRGYYYDAETGFYCLQSRYYDPEIGRFINPDSFLITGQDFTGFNLFAYCGDNPVNRADATGEVFVFLLGTTTQILPPSLVGTATGLGSLGSSISTITVPSSTSTIPIVSPRPGRRFYDMSDLIADDYVEDTRGPIGKPNRKKQGREVNNKSRQKDGWKSNPNKNPNRSMKKHTPGRDHRKYKIEVPFIRIESPIEEIRQRITDNNIERAEGFEMIEPEKWDES